MGLGQLTIVILIIAAALTALTGLVMKRNENWLVSYLQHATGSLFIFSGWVKVVDPMGTGFKLEQYFAEFQATFEGTWFSFIAPLFPMMGNYALAMSVVVIIVEILLGIMLILGMWRKFTAWAFFLLVAFFTFLTGFTYLTGYVPSGVNFFQFSQWGEYNPTNMRVTDCGCFGDFIVIEPKVSFFKDLILLVPAIFFLFTYGKMHQLFNEKVRHIVVVASSIILLVYAFSNFAWNLPHIDFRAFHEGADIRTQLNLERDAAANVQVVAWDLKNNETGEVIRLSTEEYFANLTSYRETHSVVRQIQSEPEIEETKVSDFMINDLEGFDVTDDFLEYSGHSIMIVTYNLPGSTIRESQTVMDSIFAIDSITMVGQDGMDSLIVIERLDEVIEREEEILTYNWNERFNRHFHEKIIPFVNAASERGVQIVLVSGEGNTHKLESFQREMGMENVSFYFADDILLKTIIRSSPGVVWWHDGVILKKWHKSRLPEFQSIETDLLAER